jgi:putative DNA primase/helicase
MTAAPPTVRPSTTEPVGHGLSVMSFADVPICRQPWLWRGVVPAGGLTLLTGDPSVGKSVLTVDWAARVSRGAPWPDAKKCRAGTTVFLSPEDEEGSTVLPRYLAAGGDTAHAHFVRGVPRADGTDAAFSLAADIDKLDRLLRQLGDVRLVVVDPLNAYLAGVGTGRDAEVRAVLGPLVKLARRHRAAVVGVVHLNKSGKGRALYRSLGSIGVAAVARAAWVVAADPRGGEGKGGTRRVMLPTKFNLGPTPPGIAFRIVSAPGKRDVPVVRYDAFDLALDPDEVVAVAAVKAGPTASPRVPKTVQAVEFLRNAFVGRASIPYSELRGMTDAAGIGWRTVGEPAVRSAGLSAFKDGRAWAYRLTGTPR